MPRILVVDDEPLVVECFRYAFPAEQYTIDAATCAAEAVNAFRRNSIDAVIVDVFLPGSSGLQVLKDIHAIDSKVPIILMTGHGTANTAIEAMRQGAFEYLLKPLDPDELQSVVGRALEASRMTRNPVALPIDAVPDDETELLIGQCPAMQEVYRQIGRIAGRDVTVLILGESGTGKEVVARAIYQYSKRVDKPFRAINCAAIPENLLESELFGHERGAFTGADRNRIGKFEQCDGGTLFLDEIGDMTPLTQTKILRVLQDQQFERVGGNETVRTNVRLIAATNRNLTEMMQQETFRSDLFYRLNVYTIHLPPLRDRNGDLPLLICRYITRFSRELGKDVDSVSPKAMTMLATYSWPGNIRELQSVLKHAIVQSTGSVLLPEFLPETVREADEVDQETFATSKLPTSPEGELDCFIKQQIRLGTNNLYDEIIHRVERVMLTELLHQVDSNLSRASAILGISRSTLRIKLAALGISVDRTIHMSS